MLDLRTLAEVLDMNFKEELRTKKELERINKTGEVKRGRNLSKGEKIIKKKLHRQTKKVNKMRW